MPIKKPRLPYFDYSSNGAYFVTLVSKDRKPVLKENETTIENILHSINTPGVSVDYHCIMPDHMHVIFLLESSETALGEIIRRFKARTSYETGESLWQPNYYEHVVRSEKALMKIREYIQNNPDAEMVIAEIVEDEKRKSTARSKSNAAAR